MGFQAPFRIAGAALAAMIATCLSVGASAETMPPVVLLPSAGIPPKPQQATIYALNQRLPQGRGLAALLLRAGVGQDDAGLAARLAAGHLGDGAGGCEAKVEISHGFGDERVTLERIVLTTANSETVIERHAGSLTLASADVRPSGWRIA